VVISAGLEPTRWWCCACGSACVHVRVYMRAACLDCDAPLCVPTDNAMFYARNGVPFVLGTTGGDRQAMMQQVVDSGVYAVIAPQMGKQVCSCPPGALPLSSIRSQHE
jgi:hypothetical protein